MSAEDAVVIFNEKKKSKRTLSLMLVVRKVHNAKAC